METYDVVSGEGGIAGSIAARLAAENGLKSLLIQRAQAPRDKPCSGIQFAVEHPQYAEISGKILESKGKPLNMEVIADNFPSTYEIFETLLENAIVRGEVRADIDIKMFAHLITAMNTLVIEYYIEYLAQEYDGKMIESIDKF